MAGAAVLRAVPGKAAALRLAVMDWALLETSLALGIVPAAAVELLLYRKVVVEPEVPAGVVDLGLRGSPNFELLAAVAPDLIYGSNFTAWAHEALGRIAPVRSLSIYEPGSAPYAQAEEAARSMGRDLGIEARAEALVADIAREIGDLKRRLHGQARGPLFLVNFGDPRHVRVFGQDSMFGDVLARLGLDNAWQAQTSYSATAPVDLAALAAVPAATIVAVGPTPPEVERGLAENAIWQALPAVRQGRVAWLAPTDPYGGLPAARRFARVLGEAVLSGEPEG